CESSTPLGTPSEPLEKRTTADCGFADGGDWTPWASEEGLKVIRISEKNFCLPLIFSRRSSRYANLIPASVSGSSFKRARSRKARDVMICFRPANWEQASI